MAIKSIGFRFHNYKKKLKNVSGAIGDQIGIRLCSFLDSSSGVKIDELFNMQNWF